MKAFNIDDAFKLRTTVKGMTHAQKLVFQNIICGEYDKYALEAKDIANEYLEFLTKENK